jgi:hypothetical protein
MASRPQKRQRRRGGGGASGDTVEDFHKDRAKREAERNAEAKQRAQEISKLLRDDKAMKEKIEALKQETAADPGRDNINAVKALESNLAKLQQDAQRRLSKQELDSEIAVRRRLAAGLAVGPAPPNGDPPRRGPGFPSPIPPPYRELPIPPPPPRPIQPLLKRSDIVVLHQQESAPVAATVAFPVEEKDDGPKAAKKLFMPTSVAVNLKRSS